MSGAEKGINIMAKLIQGFREVLTPINLLPNSTFNGIDRTGVRHFDVLPKSTNEYIITNGFGTGQMGVFLRSPNAVINNVNVTVGGGSIKVTGTAYSNETAVPAFWVCFSSPPLAGGKIYTLGAYFKDNHNCYGININSANASNGLYYDDWRTNSKKSESELKRMLCVRYIITNPSNNYLATQFALYNKDGSTGPINFSFTVQDFFIYEGAYVNPPVTTSLDTKPKPQFIKNDLSNFPSRIHVFNFDTINYLNHSTLNGHTFLANKWYNLLRITSNDALSGITTDGMEYINIRGINFYPDILQIQASCYELKIFWHEVSRSGYVGVYPSFIEPPIIKNSIVYDGSYNQCFINNFRLKKSSTKIYYLQWQVGSNNLQRAQHWTMEVDILGRIINQLGFTPWDAKANGSNDYIAYG